MAAYRKFSEAWWPTPRNQDQACPTPKAPKPPKPATEPDTLGALDGLAGVPADFRKSEAVVDGPGASADSALLAGVPPIGSDSVYVEAGGQNKNYFLERATEYPELVAKPARPPPAAEKQICGCPAAKAPKPTKVEPVDDLAEHAAIIKKPADVQRRWAEGYAALCMMPPPFGFSPERWRRVVDAAGTFLDRWGAEAIRCGWSDLDVFGVHQDAPTARFDAMGLVLLLDRAEVIAVDRDGADLLIPATGSRQRYRRRPLPPDTVALWRLRIVGEPR